MMDLELLFSKEIAKTLGVTPDKYFHEDEEILSRVNFLIEYAIHSRSNGYVLGISGGQDSTLTGKLCLLATEVINEAILRGEKYIKKEVAKNKFITFYVPLDKICRNSYVFKAVSLPYKKQKDFNDVIQACDFIGVNLINNFNVVNIAPPVDSLCSVLSELFGEISDFNKGNIKARMRMVIQYKIAAKYNLLVAGCDHASEALTGFYTKFGDGAADVMPLDGLTKEQGRKILKYLDCPEELYLKTPTADLLDESPLQSDEDELGIKYTDIDLFLNGKLAKGEAYDKIISQYMKTEHKRRMPVTPKDTWWRTNNGNK